MKKKNDTLNKLWPSTKFEKEINLAELYRTQLNFDKHQ